MQTSAAAVLPAGLLPGVERVMNDPWGELTRLSFDELCRR